MRYILLKLKNSVLSQGEHMKKTDGPKHNNGNFVKTNAWKPLFRKMKTLH